MSDNNYGLQNGMSNKQMTSEEHERARMALTLAKIVADQGISSLEGMERNGYIQIRNGPRVAAYENPRVWPS